MIMVLMFVEAYIEFCARCCLLYFLCIYELIDPLGNSEGSIIVILSFHMIKVEEKRVKVNYSGHRAKELTELGSELRQIYSESYILNYCSIQENSCMC